VWLIWALDSFIGCWCFNSVFSVFGKVKELKEEFNREETVIELPKEVKNKITDEILERLRSLNANANISEQRSRFIFQSHVVLFCNCLFYFKLIHAIRIGLNTCFVRVLKVQRIWRVLFIKQQLIWYNAENQKTFFCAVSLELVNSKSGVSLLLLTLPYNICLTAFCLTKQKMSAQIYWILVFVTTGLCPQPILVLQWWKTKERRYIFFFNMLPFSVLISSRSYYCCTRSIEFNGACYHHYTHTCMFVCMYQFIWFFFFLWSA